MALTRTNQVGEISADGHGTGAFTTSSFTPPDNSLLVVAAGAMDVIGGVGLDTALTMAGGSLTFTRQVNVEAGGGTAFSIASVIWTAPVTTGASMTLSLDAGTRNLQIAAVNAVAYTGYDTGTPVNGTGTVVDTASPDGAQSITLSAAPTTADEAFGSICIDKDTGPGTTPGATFSELYDLQAGGTGGIESEIRTASTSTTVDWVDTLATGGSIFKCCATALVVKAAAGGAVASARVSFRPGKTWKRRFKHRQRLAFESVAAAFAGDASLTVTSASTVSGRGEGAASSTVTATTTAAGSAQGAATLTITETTTASGTAQGSASLTETATITAAGNMSAAGTASLTVTETTTASGTAQGSTSLTVTATITAVGALGGNDFTGTTSLTGTASVTASGTAQGTSSLTETATVTASGAAQGAASSTVTATITAVGLFGSNDFTGTAALTETATVTAAGTMAAAGTASLTGTVTVTVVGSFGTGVAEAAGSWGGLLAVVRESYATYALSLVEKPVACPNDGTPLEVGPDGRMVCPFDGWEDWLTAR